jgi:hypothetical protein
MRERLDRHGGAAAQLYHQQLAFDPLTAVLDSAFLAPL